ncbi:MAG: response regulator [Calditrichaeota bacterium]|nr:response regulator [Calditrichota bacterium]
MRVLLIDDEKTIRRAILFALRGRGVEALECQNALEALQRPDLERFDLMIVDLNLPLLSGEEFLQKLRSLHVLAPLILFTSENPAIIQQHIPENDRVKIISKDLSLNEILHEIDHFIQPSFIK